MGVSDHRRGAEESGRARCTILTVSDTRVRETDESGRMAVEILGKFGHEVVDHAIVPNIASKIRSAVERGMEGSDLVLTLGGTGAGPRDITVETVRPLFVKEFPGFGELFRSTSAKEIGTAAMLSRATLGVAAEGKVIVSLPGSPAAVQLALEGILMNELKHLLSQAKGSK